MERRSAVELRADGARRLIGYASVWDAVSEGLPWREIVRRGAYANALKSNHLDPVALLNHQGHLVLGRRSSGTLRLEEDAHGLRFEIDVPRTTVGDDLLESVRRSDIKGASVGFAVREGGQTWSEVEGVVTRTLTDLDLYDVSPTPMPIFPDTSLGVRSLDAWRNGRQRPRLARLKLFLETV